MACVQGLLHEATLGDGAALLVAGERGIGKSRFLHESARLKSSAVAVPLRCGGASGSGYGLAHQLGEALHPGSARGSAPVYDQLSDACRRRPTALFVDDLHLASQDDVRTFFSLLSLTQRLRLVVVAAFAPGALAPATGLQLRRFVDGGVRYAQLEPLSESESELLIRGLARQRRRRLETEELKRMLYTAQGNPRFAVELATRAGDDRRVAFVPSSAAAVVAAVRERLSRQDFETLRLCSVVGDGFRDQWIVDLAQRSRGAVADALQAANEAGVLVERADAPGWFDFRHVAVRQALVASSVSLKRRILHERVAEYLSAAGAGTADGALATLIAGHWDALENHPNAATWLTRAGQAYEARDMFAEAADLFTRAASHLEHASPEWFAVNHHVRRCYRNLGEWARMVPVAESMLDALDPDDRDGADSLLWDLYYGYFNKGDRVAGRRAAEQIAALAAPSDPNGAEITTLLQAYSLCYMGPVAEARKVFDLVDQSALRDDVARMRYFVAKAEIGALHAPLDETLSLIDRATELARRLGIRGTAYTQEAGAEISLRYGALDTARVYVQRAAETATASVGDVNDVKRSVVKMQMRILLLAGDLAGARRLVVETLDWRDGGLHIQACLSGVGVIVGMRLGDLALVDALFDPALLAESVATADAEACGLLLPGFAEVMQARNMSKELRGLLQRCVDNGLVDPYTWILQGAARHGTLECADQAAALLGRYLDGATAPLAAAHRALFDAILLRRHSKPIAAAERARDAAERYARIGWRLEEATALEVAGDQAAASSAYVRCGAAYDVERLARGLSRKSRRAPFGARLTARELEVARLVARKRSNTEVARALEISVRTVHHHVEAVFNKLGLQTRRQLTEDALR
jgi:DNA-binding CsgD family transcriptional regulator/tetratricopeptide (TPR) repeat protein